MDKLLYIAASGAKQDLLGTAVRANNLANAQTTGFKAMLENARAMPAYGEGMPTRVFSMTESPSNNYAGGAMIQTGRELDAAIQGEGWFSVIDAQGNEAYTRAGSLQMGADGRLEDAHGNTIAGDAGAIFLPIPLSNVNIANDGTISVRPQGAPATVLEEVARLKFVNPNVRDMERGEDGLFRLKNGQEAAEDINVRIRTGMLEGSNVNAIEEMVNMISASRSYKNNVEMINTTKDLLLQTLSLGR